MEVTNVLCSGVKIWESSKCDLELKMTAFPGTLVSLEILLLNISTDHTNAMALK